MTEPASWTLIISPARSTNSAHPAVTVSFGLTSCVHPVQVVWQKTLGKPVPSTSLPCGNISPYVGVTSTPVLNATTGALVISAKTLNGTTQV